MCISMKFRYSVLTYLFGTYETLHEIQDVQNDVEYICVTDDPNLKSDTWTIVYDPINTEFTPFRKVVEVRYNPFHYVHTDICMLIDGSLELLKFPRTLFQFMISANYEFATFAHPSRNSLDVELDVWKKCRNLPEFDQHVALEFLKNINYDISVKGLVQINFMLVRKTQRLQQFFNSCLKINNNLAEANSTFRVDQVILSALLIHRYSNSLRHVLISSDEMFGSYLQSYLHNSKTKHTNGTIKQRSSATFNNNQVNLRSFSDFDIDLTIGICNFNTTTLTNACIRSIYKHLTIPYRIVVLDNSDHHPFKLSTTDNSESVKVLDNTKEQLINFKKLIAEFGGNSINNYANFKHTCSIQFLLDACETEHFLLLDSDVLMQKDLDFIDSRYATIADVQNSYATNADTGFFITRFKRFMPFIQYFNVLLLRQHHVKYLDYTRIVGSKFVDSVCYDTGSSFYQDVILQNLPFKQLSHEQYVKHLMGSSWAKVHDPIAFLVENSTLYT